MPYASSIQIVNDANGAAYAFLANNGQIWQCQWNAQAQQWDQAEAVPGAQGGEKLQALYLNQLWPSSAAGAPGSAGGVLLAYKVGRGSGSEIMASFGQWNSQGELIWSEPLPLTNDAVEEQAFALVGGKEGDFALVTQKQADGPGIEELLARFSSTAEGQLQSELDAAAIQERPDSDLYLNRFQLQQPSSGSGWNLVNVSEPQTQATVGPVVLAPLPPLVAPAPLAVGGNTELSRKALLMAPVTTSGSQSNRQGGTTSMLGATSDSSEESSSSTSSGVSYKGGAAGQYNTKNGGAVRFGALAFQDPLRWRVAIPKYKYDGENPLLEGVPSDGPPL